MLSIIGGGGALAIENKPRNHRNDVVLANKDFETAIIYTLKGNHKHNEKRD